jgi:type II secretory pathway pseudopilin PulG
MKRGASLAFSLVELLVVIAIVATLVALLIPAISLVRFQAKVTGTVQRMLQVQTALADYVGGGRGVAALQRAASLGGPVQMSDWWTIANSLPAGSAAPPALLYTDYRAQLRGQQTLEVQPDIGFVVPNAAWWTTTWPFLWPTTDWGTMGSTPPILPYPWGRPGLCNDLQQTTPGTGIGATGRTFNAVAVNNRYMIGSGAASVEAPASQSITRSDGTTATVTADNPCPFDLGQTSPLQTVPLLTAAGILEAGSDYAADRNPNRPWNDLWGNPLIVTYAVFHPAREANASANANINRDRYLKAAMKQYGYGKAVYVAVGATGPALRSGIASDASSAVSLRDRWNQIRDTCQAVEWTELTWAAPPSDWKDVRKVSKTVDGVKETCLLTAPMELK